MCNNPVIAALPSSTFTDLLQDSLLSLLLCLVSCCPHQFRGDLLSQERERAKVKGGGKRRLRKWIEKIGDGVYRTARGGMDIWCKSTKTSRHVLSGAGARWNANDGTGAKNRNGPACQLGRERVQPAYRVRVSLNELANCSQRCGCSALPCNSDPRDITTRKEKAKYSGPERERKRGREKVREKERRDMQLEHCIFCPLVTFMIRVKQRFSPVLLALVRPFFSVFFLLFCIF